MTSREEVPTESEHTAAGRAQASSAASRWRALFALAVVRETVQPEHASLWLQPPKEKTFSKKLP